MQFSCVWTSGQEFQVISRSSRRQEGGREAKESTLGRGSSGETPSPISRVTSLIKFTSRCVHKHVLLTNKNMLMKQSDYVSNHRVPTPSHITLQTGSKYAKLEFHYLRWNLIRLGYGRKCKLNMDTHFTPGTQCHTAVARFTDHTLLEIDMWVRVLLLVHTGTKP